MKKIESLKDNWNGNGAKAFDKQLLDMVKEIIESLDRQPEVFPTACNSIQIEYDKNDGSYLEIELSLSKQWGVFTVDSTGKEFKFIIPANTDNLIQVINDFYKDGGKK